MKTIGLIGGMSWESSALYYRIINEEIKARLGGLHSAKCVLHSVDFEEIVGLQKNGEWDKAGDTLLRVARGLELAGADFIIICTNTMHKVADHIQDNISIPLLHIADVAAVKIVSQGIRTIGLLGTRYTMEQDFYKARLRDKGVNVVIPNEEDRQYVNQVIFQELCIGQTKHESKIEYQRIMQGLIDFGAEGIILGCTEICMLIKQEDSFVPLYDTTLIHAKGAVDYALGGLI